MGKFNLKHTIMSKSEFSSYYEFDTMFHPESLEITGSIFRTYTDLDGRFYFFHDPKGEWHESESDARYALLAEMEKNYLNSL